MDSTINDIRSSVSHIQTNKNTNGISKQNKDAHLLDTRTANDWIKESKLKPIPDMLFNELWHERELCILFADTNQGKSILAVQIANSISSGTPIPNFKLEAPKQVVLYFDFELSSKQFEGRYSTKNKAKKRFENHYNWNENFFRVELNQDAIIPADLDFETYLNQSIEEEILLKKAKVIIIDNLTYLKTSVEKAKDAAPFIQWLRGMVKKYDISILVLTHTPKRDLSKPINRNEISGSKRLIDFCDSAFAIGESNLDKSIKYIKQIKTRETEFFYDTDNVITCQIIKKLNFLQLEFLRYGSENDHLKAFNDNDKKRRVEEVIEFRKQGLTYEAIAQKYEVSEGAIRKWEKPFKVT